MIEAYGRTDVGRRRKINEDSFLVSPETSLYAVCDGMGGHNAGEVASKMAIETISAFVERSAVEKEITWPWGLDANVSFEANRLKTAIRLANARVYQAADNREELTGMGTTVVAALVSPGLVTIGSAGDSRCYRVRDGELSQLTRDDSWVSAALGEGILNSDDVEHHPLRNVITKAVGARDTIDLDVVEHELKPGDLLMLCSDGLHGMINDQEIKRLLVPVPESLEEASARLIDAANEGYPRDPVPMPSPGVGGVCLKKDPYLLKSTAEARGIQPSILGRSRQVNEYMHNSPHPGKDRTGGHFGFAGHSDPVEFRNVRIKRLSGT